MGPVSDTYKLTYNALVIQVVQQKNSRFIPFFNYQAELSGRSKMLMDLLEPTEAIVDGVRGGDTPNIDANHEPVWCQPRQIEWGKLIEKEDFIKALTDYESPYVQNGGSAIVRGRDLILSTAILGNRIIGLDGTTVTAWGTSFVNVQTGNNTNRFVADTVGSADGATATGWNVRKINRAKRLLEQQQVELDYEMLCGTLNAQGAEELYNDIITINTDYKKMAVLDEQNKSVKRVAMVDFASYENFALPAGYATDYQGAIWCKSGMHWGDFDPLTTNVEPNPGKKYRLHPYMENWFGASRSEDAKVVQVLAAINPAGING